MIIHCPSSSLYRAKLLYNRGSSKSHQCQCQSRLVTRSAAVRISTATIGAIAAAVMMAAVSVASAELPPPPQDGETLSNVPQTLSGEDCKKQRIQRPKSKNAEKCTVKCVNTCIRSGDGEGPINIRRPLVVFKQGFRSRNYCLVECSDICNLIGDGDYGP
ncbi:hypothetical protein AtNW77_Chr1g0081271 [Arabidopsis thaliana]|jgi:hypothetical protein|uniref:Uncharacterized protein n=4 Tax=Arabidopsis TaxID=3701 RepID=A0A178W746_ARATH|nr:uncharacterized protein AT1G78995 [Arabidopsis thaliana]KAG7652225.1 hypothetical protein ISN45_At01g069850 [Arabidopsis thaliana x Arabidopsis arenosa]KAG7660083.1 hypothetical protein ISN44_As01g068750 [Arabidopsis suecica]AAM63739.1 unknown [Arabidopsis thaliana]AAM97130.1 expressed protein [Arabidopsis thaliana]AAP21350.1 At1g78995 [Arabidopsis thaliana]|eukprot:NP_565196.1 hypothetical protein AT1G78995 [Arabidopsis thaliana]